MARLCPRAGCLSNICAVPTRRTLESSLPGRRCGRGERRAGRARARGGGCEGGGGSEGVPAGGPDKEDAAAHPFGEIDSGSARFSPAVCISRRLARATFCINVQLGNNSTGCHCGAADQERQVHMYSGEREWRMAVSALGHGCLRALSSHSRRVGPCDVVQRCVHSHQL